MLAGSIACAMSIMAAGLVYYSWRQHKAAAAATGWLLAFTSALVWSQALGPEIGVTYAIVVFVCLVWIEIAFTTDLPGAAIAAPPRPMQRLHRPQPRELGTHGTLFLLSVPAAGVITMLLSVALVLYLPWTMPHKFAVAILLYPMLWGALSAWICAQREVLKPVFVCVGLLAVSCLLLFI